MFPITIDKKQIITAAILTVIFGAPLGYIVHDFASISTTPAVVAPAVVEKDKEKVDEVAQKVAVGELVKIKGIGVDTVWTVEPAIDDTQIYGSSDENFVCSFRKVGRYIVYESYVEHRWFHTRHLKVNRTVFNVGIGSGNVPVVTDPLVDKFNAWGIPDKSQAAALAAAFRSVATQVQSQVSAGSLVDATKIMSLTKDATQKALGSNVATWRPFFDKLNADLGAQSDAGTLTTMADHVRVWNQLANAFDTVSQ